MFAGVGPFALPAAKKKKCIVLANDLNPESYKWLNVNIKLNKIKQEVKTFNLDGREFVRDVVKNHLLSRWMDDMYQSYKIHIVMNLPALAVEFIDVFPGLFERSELDSIKLFVPPIVHCYTFSKDPDPESDVKQRVETNIKCDLKDYSIRTVRNVAPNKEMLYVTFPLTKDILFGVEDKSGDVECHDEPTNKKMKLAQDNMS